MYVWGLTFEGTSKLMIEEVLLLSILINKVNQETNSDILQVSLSFSSKMQIDDQIKLRQKEKVA